MIYMLNYNPITNMKGRCIAVSRAAVGIYLALLDAGVTSGNILVPGNLCYAGIFPAIYAGLTPKFCDVDPKSGNVNLETVSAALDETVTAAVIPHMYGNPLPDFPEICALLRDRNVIIIEDGASAMGVTPARYTMGELSDYTVYSTGKSKTVDLGFGGLLFSKCSDLSVAQGVKKTLPTFEEVPENNLGFFSKLYRFLRNNPDPSELKDNIYQSLCNFCKDDFLFNLPEQTEAGVFKSAELLEGTVKARRQKNALYGEKITTRGITPYEYSEGAVPWRYNFLIDEALRNGFVAACLKEGLPISDWYPNITPFFGKRRELAGIDSHERCILNFPLLTENGEIEKICSFINRYF